MSALKKKNKIRKNKKKGRARAGKRVRLNINWSAFLAYFGSVLCFGALSCTLVFSYAFITQSKLFSAEKIEIKGIKRLSEREVLETAEIYKGKNIFHINLNVAQQKLLSHPWIKKAEVIREMPDGIEIRVIEHVPLAIVEFKKKYLINRDGEIFKRYSKEPEVLPLISGFSTEDINVAGRCTMKIETEPHKAVMNIIKIAKEPKSAIAYKDIKKILVDRELGLTLVTGSGIEKIKLGYHNYNEKVKRFDEVSQILRKKANLNMIDTIDLNDFNRIVVKPAKQEA